MPRRTPGRSAIVQADDSYSRSAVLFRILTRHILFELVKTTLLTAIALTLLMLIGGAMIEASKRGLDPIKLLIVMPFLLPPTLPFIVPTSVLFAVTFVYGRMSGNAEIIALKAAGIHIGRMMTPAFALAAVAAGVVGYATYDFIPKSNLRLAEWLLSDLRNNVYAVIKLNKHLRLPDLPYEIYVDDVRGDKLIKPYFIKYGVDGRAELMAQAQEATLFVEQSPDRSGEQLTIGMHDVTLTDNKTRNGINSRMAEYVISLPIPKLNRPTETKFENLTVPELFDSAERDQVASFAWKHGLSCDVAFDVLSGSPENLPLRVVPANAMSESHARRAREAVGEAHARFVQSAATVFFVLLGCPVGILFQRRDFLHSFFLCFAPVLGLFYPTLVLSFNMYKESSIDSPLIIWSPIAAMMMAAAPLLLRSWNR